MKANKYEAYYKVLKVIESCETLAQCNVADRMVLNFRRLYEDMPLFFRLDNELMRHYDITIMEQKLNDRLKQESEG